MVRLGRPLNRLLGQGDESLANRLGGTFGPAADDSVRLTAGFGARFFKNARAEILAAAGASRADTGAGGEHGPLCVDAASFLPNGQRAGHVLVGDLLDTLDPITLEPGKGRVTASRRAPAVRYQLRTLTGGLLVCSESAKIPVEGNLYRTPPMIEGYRTAIVIEGRTLWDTVIAARCVGRGFVQHITLEGPDDRERCFLAGEFDGAYLLHHNIKSTTSGPE